MRKIPRALTLLHLVIKHHVERLVAPGSLPETSILYFMEAFVAFFHYGALIKQLRLSQLGCN